MKATMWIVSLLLCAVLPVGAQQSLVSVTGVDFGVTGIDGLGAGWSLNERFVNVKIAAHLSNGGGSARGIAYLMRSVGPGTSCTQEIVTTRFDLPPGYNGMFTLFSNLDLDAGNYWLVFSKPRYGPFSYANWTVSNPATVTTSNAARYLGTLYATSGVEQAEYAPATDFDILLNGWAYHIDVSGEPYSERRRRIIR